jgi:hypothetical protein
MAFSLQICQLTLHFLPESWNIYFALVIPELNILPKVNPSIKGIKLVTLQIAFGTPIANCKSWSTIL